jgi:hypothetical protein
MELRVYEILFQFNQGINQALESLSIVEKLELGSTEGVGKVRNYIGELHCYANSHFASKIVQKEQEGENNFYRVRRNREKAEEGPNEIYFELKAVRSLGANRVCRPAPQSFPGLRLTTIAFSRCGRLRSPRSRHGPDSFGP